MQPTFTVVFFLGFNSGIFLGIYSIARFFITQENVSHCGSTTTGKPIVGLLCWNVGWLGGGGPRQ